MALTLNNFVGFETGGLQEAKATSGTPVAGTSVVRTGSYSLEKPVAGSATYDVELFEGGSSDIGDDYVVGFAIYIEDKTPAGNRVFFEVLTDAGDAFQLLLETDSDLQVNYDSGAADTISDPFTENTWHYIEIKWQYLASANFDLWIDGSSALSTSGKDCLAGTTLDAYQLTVSSTDAVAYVDDFYCGSGASATSDFLGPRTEVLGAYQNTVEDATDQGDALINGQWSDVGEVPFSDITQADYQQNAAIGGFTICDEGNRAGPAGDAPGTITGAKYIQRLNRTNGSSPTTLDKSVGNSADGMTHTDLASVLTVAHANFFTVSEAAGIVPTNSENFAFGMRQTGSGGRDIGSHEMMAMLLHTQGALSTTLADLNFPDQNYYLGPFGT